jgi:hypothetical protein
MYSNFIDFVYMVPNGVMNKVTLDSIYFIVNILNFGLNYLLIHFSTIMLEKEKFINIK